MEVRLAEHQRHVRKGEITRSAIAEHAILQVHRMDWESARVIDTSKKKWQRLVKEALHSAQREKKINKDNGQQLSKVWLDVLWRLHWSYCRCLCSCAILQVFYVVVGFFVLCNCLKSPLWISLFNYLRKGRTVPLETSR